MSDDIFQKLKKVKFKKIIYPVLSGLFAVLILAAFAYVVWFLSSNLNKVFKSPEETPLTEIDKANYNIVAKKLGLPLLED